MPDESLLSTLAALSGVVSCLWVSTRSWESLSPGRPFFDFAKADVQFAWSPQIVQILGAIIIWLEQRQDSAIIKPYEIFCEPIEASITFEAYPSMIS